MPNKSEHVSAGFWLVGIFNFVSSAARQNNEVRLGLRQDTNIWEAVGDGIVGGIGGAVGSILPDVLDPPINPNHRGRGHSIGNLLLSLKFASETAITNNVKLDRFIKSLAGGNALHILQDSQTPKGIPII